MTAERRAELVGQVQDFWRRVAVGDPSTRDMLKEFADASPQKFVEMFRGDVARRVIDAILDRVAGQDLGQRQAILTRTEEHGEALAGAFPTAIESLLAERAAVLHLAAYEADLFQYCNMDMLSSKKADFHERRRDRANRRYLSALKSLAMVQERLRLAEARRERTARDEVTRFRVGSGSDRLAAVN
jgi:hypothetical protein